MAETEGWFQFSDKTSTTTNFWVKVPDCSEDMFVPCDNFALNRHLCASEGWCKMAEFGAGIFLALKQLQLWELSSLIF